MVRLLWCPVCGHSDRHSTLGRDLHYSNGRRCPGEPIRVEYKPVRQGALRDVS